MSDDCVDFSVLIGASRTSWDIGQSVSATQLLLTLARALSQLYHNSDDPWLPKFTVRLVSWGGADVNDRGMMEFIEVLLSTATGTNDLPLIQRGTRGIQTTVENSLV